MALAYRIVEIYTSEESRYKGRSLGQAVTEYVHDLKIAARCIVLKGVAGCYENGEMATFGIEVLSFDLPVKIEIVLPAGELEIVVAALEEMVTDGIVLVREATIHAYHAQTRLLPRHLKVRDVMTPHPKSVGLETPALDIARLLLSHDFNGVPVLDEEDRPAGMVTQRDLIERAQMPVRLGLLGEMDDAQKQSLLEPMSKYQAQEIMSWPPIVVKETFPLYKAVETMLEKGLKRLPVVDAQGRLSGMLARVDVFRAIARELPDWKPENHPDIQVRDARTVGDVARRDMHTVAPNASIEKIVQAIGSNCIQRVAVVNGEGRLVGLISDRVLLGLFAGHHPGFWETLVGLFASGSEGEKRAPLPEEFRAKTAQDLMRTDLVVVDENSPLDEAIRVMAEKGIKRLPVIDAEGKFKGMVSRDSLLRTGLEKS
jgi:CBS domain-containing protein